MFEAGIMGTLEDVLLGGEDILRRSAYAVSNACASSSSSSKEDDKVKKSTSKEDKEADKRMLQVATEWFDNLSNLIVVKDKRFIPSFEEFMDDYFSDKGFATFETDIVKKMMSNSDTYQKMISKISDVFKVKAEDVHKKIMSYQKTEITDAAGFNMDIMNYIKSGKDVIETLAKIDSGEITPAEGIDKIKKMNADIVLDASALIKDVETKMAQSTEQETKVEVESESVLEITGKKNTMSLKEAIQETPLGQRLFTRMEEAVANA